MPRADIQINRGGLVTQYRFDFIASSPLWRAHNTIMPYLRATKRKAEIWPELREGHGNGSILSKDIPVLEKEIVNLGELIILPNKENPFFNLREDAKNNYSQYSEEWDGTVKVSYMKHAC